MASNIHIFMILHSAVLGVVLTSKESMAIFEMLDARSHWSETRSTAIYMCSPKSLLTKHNISSPDDAINPGSEWGGRTKGTQHCYLEFENWSPTTEMFKFYELHTHARTHTA
jgi:hypothetical protein